VEHGAGRGVHEPAEQRQLDHRVLGLGDRQEPGLDVDGGQRDAVQLADLGRVGHELGPGARPQHDRGDDVAGAGGVVVEQAQLGVGPQAQPELLEELAAGRLAG
jgi:hypothetical protein